MNTTKIHAKSTRLIAHRGLSKIEPENTAAAFIAAGNRSYYGIENDIYRTTDGRFAVHHDKSLKRMSGEDRIVSECSLAQLQSLILLDENGTKTRPELRVPALEEYLNICRRYEKHSVIELKSEFTAEEISKIIALVRTHWSLEQVTFISFHYENLALVRAQLPKQSVQFLFSEITDEILARVTADHMDVDVYHRALTKEAMDAFHAAGISVNAWTVDDPEEAERLCDWGIDFITTNILESD